MIARGQIDCPIDPAIGVDDPNNVFTCFKNQTCCTLKLEPACCTDKDIMEELKFQAALWLPLLGVILVLSLFIWWCRSDETYFDVERPCLVQCGCKKLPEDLEKNFFKSDDEGIGGSRRASTHSVKSSTTVVAAAEDEVTHESEKKELEAAVDNFEGLLDPETEAAADDAAEASGAATEAEAANADEAAI